MAAKMDNVTAKGSTRLHVLTHHTSNGKLMYKATGPLISDLKKAKIQTVKMEARWRVHMSQILRQ